MISLLMFTQFFQFQFTIIAQFTALTSGQRFGWSHKSDPVS